MSKKYRFSHPFTAIVSAILIAIPTISLARFFVFEEQNIQKSVVPPLKIIEAKPLGQEASAVVASAALVASTPETANDVPVSKVTASEAQAVPAQKPVEVTPVAAPAPTAKETVTELEIDSFDTICSRLSKTPLVLFQNSSKTLDRNGITKLQRLLPTIKTAERINLRGRTSAARSSKKMRLIAVGRAIAVRDYLISQGIPSEKIRMFYSGAGYKISELSTCNQRVGLDFQKTP